jgi:hypothetical protein
VDSQIADKRAQFTQFCTHVIVPVRHTSSQSVFVMGWPASESLGQDAQSYLACAEDTACQFQGLPDALQFTPERFNLFFPFHRHLQAFLVTR